MSGQKSEVINSRFGINVHLPVDMYVEGGGGGGGGGWVLQYQARQSAFAMRDC